MSDKIFERSLSGLTLLVLLWIIMGIIFNAVGWGWVIVIGLLVEIVGGGLLLHYWGQSYMARQ